MQRFSDQTHKDCIST